MTSRLERVALLAASSPAGVTHETVSGAATLLRAEEIEVLGVTCRRVEDDRWSVGWRGETADGLVVRVYRWIYPGSVDSWRVQVMLNRCESDYDGTTDLSVSAQGPTCRDAAGRAETLLTLLRDAIGGGA